MGGARGARLALGGLLLLATVTLGCKRKGQSPPALAQVTETYGQAEIEKEGRWRKAVLAASLAPGDALRTGGDSSARIRFAVGREVALRERSMLRVGTDADSSVHVSIELGEAEIEGDGELQVDTMRGPARLDAGTRLRVKVEAEGTRYEVVVGRAVLGEGAQAVSLGQGDGMRLRMGSAQVEQYRIEVGTAQMEPHVAAIADAGPAAVAEPTPHPAKPGLPSPPRPLTGPVDVSLPAGESATIHGAQIPVAVRLRLTSPCPGQATLSVDGQGPRRKQALSFPEARLSLPPGAHRYRIECEGAAPVSGRLEVRRDSGHSRLARRAPMNLIEADGRKYTVLYQNRLPSLTFRWPGAPAKGPYTLQVAGPGDERSFPAPRPELHLASGALTDGAHSLWFTTEAGKASPRTAVTIRFDNAAVTAEIDSPRNGAVVAGEGAVEIAGVALQGSTVAVGEAPLTVDDHGRFKGEVPRPTGDERSIAIRLQHPRGGVHYYIRRVNGADR